MNTKIQRFSLVLLLVLAFASIFLLLPRTASAVVPLPGGGGYTLGQNEGCPSGYSFDSVHGQCKPNGTSSTPGYTIGGYYGYASPAGGYINSVPTICINNACPSSTPSSSKPKPASSSPKPSASNPTCTGGQVLDDDVCICPGNTTWNGSKCIADDDDCPVGQVMVGRECVNVPPVCPATSGTTAGTSGTSGSMTLSTPGYVTEFSVPNYQGTLKVQVWGGGSNAYTNVQGEDSNWNSHQVRASGGCNGNKAPMQGSCGKATGGDLNIDSVVGVGYNGGDAPFGGAGGVWPNDINGKAPGGGAAGTFYADPDADPAGYPKGGASGAYAEKTYTPAQLAPGSTVSYWVGAGAGDSSWMDARTYPTVRYGSGGDGRIKLTWTATSQTLSLCDAGYVLQGGRCVSTASCTACPAGQTLNAQNQCVKDTTCPSGFHFDTAANKCVINPPAVCAAGYHLDTATNQCVPDTIVCPAGFVLQGGQCIAVPTCPTGQHWSGTQCVANVCVPASICSGNNVINSCTGEVIQACVSPQTCIGAGVCAIAAPNVITWQVSPILVKQGKTTNVSWNVEHVSSCTVTGTNGDSWTGLTGTKVSGAIPSQTIFTLNCTALAGSGAPNVSRSTTVNIVPTFIEN